MENFRRYKNKKVEAIEDKFEDKKNQSKASKIFNNLIEKRRKILNKLYEDVDMNKSYFKYEGSTKDVNFNELNYSTQTFNGMKNQLIKFDDGLKKQKESLKKIDEVKLVKKTLKQKEVINNIENFYNSR